MSQLLYPPSVNALSKQLNANYTAADAVITLTNTTNIQNKPGVCLINRVDTNGTLQPTANWTYIEFTATSGATLTGCSAIAGDQDQALGKVVEFISDVTQQQRILDFLLVEHNADGTHSDITATTIDIGSTIAVDAVLDQDDMASNSATALATQQSIKAYVDGKKATGAEVTTGTEDAKYATPKALADANVNTRLKSKQIGFTRNISAANGDVAITGVGFTPTSIIFIAGVAGTHEVSHGFVDSAKSMAYTAAYTTTIHAINSTACISIAPDGSNYANATLKTFDADGFTLTWTKTGSPTGTASIYALCFS